MISQAADFALFNGDGDIQSLLHNHDWADFSPSQPTEWPLLVQATICRLLLSPLPVSFLCGPTLYYFYNNAYAEMIGSKHPKALTRPFWEVSGRVVEADAA
jgi:hypothetical protein